MNKKTHAVLRAVTATAFISVAAMALAQEPPTPSVAKRAVEERRAIYTLIGGNFRPIGEVLQGRAALDATDLRKRASRVAFLAGLANEAYPEASNVGKPSTRAKAEIWSRRAEFDSLLADFARHVQVLDQVASKVGVSSDEIKAAAGAVAQDCKTCHDRFREK